MEQLRERAQQLEETLIALRREIHRFPELSFHEYRTSSRVTEELRKLGLEVQSGVGGFGVVAELRGRHPGPAIAFRADMDALPITEETGLAFASETPGVMHACGHDVHTSVLLGAAMLLAERRDDLHGTVRFLFQSAEEILAGAKAMIQEGVMEGIDEVYGVHNLPSLPAGKIGVKPGVVMGSIDRIEIRVNGRGGHGGYPEACIDPIVAASAVVMGLQAAVSREIPSAAGAVITIGTIQAGTANNIIPDYVEMTGTVRHLDAEWRRTMPERISRIVRDICRAYRCEGSVAYIEQVAPVVNDEACAAYIGETADSLVGRLNRTAPPPMTYGEDFAEFLAFAKGGFFWLGSGPQEQPELAPGLHSPRFNPDESCIAIGAAMFAGIALKRLSGR
ncbi:M20 family metallopeptidase [Paenibacillus sp. MBLB4367]|uniref:M20 metallopeptidase family protein n=1 Tax=Paenibacillus sp. MBLB4367 TaxID=3384767 RepID=UPI003907E9B1